MSEFQSKLETLLPAEELLFDSTPGFGRYKPFLEQAIAHPAKMNTSLLKFLIRKFTKPGETVLDPMCGSGSTGIVAALLGRNAVQVDIEQKFVAWAEEAKSKVEKQAVLTCKGKIKNVCGDARQLSELLKEVDVVLTSPPYSEMTSKHAGGAKGLRTNEQFVMGRSCRNANQYSENENNIGNLRHGEVDAIVTSPPYSEGIGHDSGDKASEQFSARLKMQRKYTRSMAVEGNIAKLKHGEVDAVITSPPYADAKKGGEANENIMAERWDKTAKERDWNTWGKTWKTEGRKRALKSLGSGYSKSKKNIGNLPFADAIITSPPYEAAMSAKVHTLNTEKQRKLYGEKHWATQYSNADNQIGNLRKETYLEAMLKVYTEMFKVLRPQGLAIIIIKPFIRNKKVVDLPYHTWLLLRKVGFKLAKVYKLRLRQESFWRVLYSKKYPDVPKIAHEYILVVQKPLSFSS